MLHFVIKFEPLCGHRNDFWDKPALARVQRDAPPGDEHRFTPCRSLKFGVVKSSHKPEINQMYSATWQVDSSDTGSVKAGT